jgi:hypothetical protein
MFRIKKVPTCEQERTDQGFVWLGAIANEGLAELWSLCNLAVVAYCLLVLFNVGLGRPAREWKETMFLLA